MCGRYTLTNPDGIARRYKLKQLGLDLKPSYNVAPTHDMPVIVQTEHGPTAELMKWGLIPFWSKDSKFNFHTINARSEGAEDKPSFRTPFRKRRCLIPADGFYEFKPEPDPSNTSKVVKMPYYFTLKTKDLFSLAGLYDSWKRADGSELKTYTILTTTPNSLVEPIHDRMPVILDPQNEAAWLDPDLQDPRLVHSFLKPYTPEQMDVVPVSQQVNAVKNNTQQLITPLNSQ